MPLKCSAILASIIAYVDVVLANGTALEKNALKSMFGLGLVSHDDDFARYVIPPLRHLD
jgi:hypothetical protein